MNAKWVELARRTEFDLFSRAVQKAGSEKRLAKLVKIPSASIYEYRIHHRRIPWVRFVRLRDFVGWGTIPFQRLSLNPFYQKGGNATTQRLLKENRLEKVLQKARKKAAEKLKEWHARTKETNPSLYYSIQYSRFKRIGGHKFQTQRGEHVRNELERMVADCLCAAGILYTYEPCIHVKNRCVFPDFVIGKLALECTAWKGNSKIPSLKRKISELTEAGFDVALVVPENLRETYGCLKASVLMLTELLNFVNARVAQTEFGSAICSGSGATGRAPDC